MNPLAQTETAAADRQPWNSGQGGTFEARRQTIVKWSVVGHDRLMGRVYDRPGQSNGQAVMTSPVVQVRRMGEQRWPVAFTASGTAYWLGAPAQAFGVARAEQFVRNKSQAPASQAQPALPADLQTTLIKLAD